MAASLFRQLGAEIAAATLISLEVSPGSRRVDLRLALPTGGTQDSSSREWTVSLLGVSRVAARLSRAHADADPAQALPGIRELNSLLRRWSGQELSGQRGEIFDAARAPAWLGRASLDLAWPDVPIEAHSLDLRLDDGAGIGGLELDLRIEFGDIEAARSGRTTHGGERSPWPAPAPARGAHPSDGGGPAGPDPWSYPRRRPAAVFRGKRGAIILTVAGLTLAAALAASLYGAAGARKPADPPPRAVDAPRALPAAESGLMPWHLAAPISREAVVAGPGGQLIVLGGLTAGGTSASGVYAVRPLAGALRRVGALRVPLHDAAAAVLGGRALVFGGGSPTTIAAVEAVTLHGARAATATATGSMPAPRSDAAAVTIGRTTYVVGGYTGAGPDAAVLATSNGRTFTTVASLRIPVRYPAVAALGGQIYVFGGQAISGPHAGAPVNTIQAIDPARHTAAVIGHLPEPLAGAAAMTVAGELFVAGGDSSATQHRRAGVGTTQLGPGESSGAGGAGSATSSVSTIWAFNPATRRLLAAGRLQVPVSHAGVAVVGSTAWIIGGESNGALVAAVQMLRPNRAFGSAGAPGAGSPYFGDKLLIADRGNNRLLLLSDTNRVTWRYPSAHSPPNRLRFYFPDDAFFTNHGTAIISNQEQNETIVKIAYPSGKIVWSYGHPRQPGTARGYLHEPDDAYLLKSGQITVADAMNCRVLVINPNGTIAHQIGSTGVCVHHPPTSMGSPNGDTPLADGNLLISEINGSWVSEYTVTGKLVWTVQLPISYPSDPQQLGPDRYLLADYAAPGAILEFTRKGHILYRYSPASGPGELNHPSLAELLPSGVFMVNDDYNDRMVAIDPATRALVWQYGITGRPGTAPGRLNIPDGFDVLAPNGSTPTHRTTG